jgi:AbiV family abortive infection protein
MLEGCELACENAKRLAHDAMLLGDRGCKQSAYALSVIAMEEVNKAGLLLKRYLDKQDLSKTAYENIFRDHERKLRALKEYLPILYPSAAQKPFTEQQIDVLKHVQKEKLTIGLYVDYDLGQHTWSSPKNLDGLLDKVDPKWREGLADIMAPWKVYTTSVPTLSEEIAKRVRDEKNKKS